MYRFFKVRGFTLTNRNVLTKPAYMQTSSYLCSFCKFYHAQIPKSVYQDVKYYSMTTNTVEITDRHDKKKKRKNVKYVELLEVTDSKTNNRKAKVKKLNASNLSTFVDLNSPLERKLHSDRNQILRELKSSKRKLTESKSKKEEEVKAENNPSEVSEKSSTCLETDKISYYKKKQTKIKYKLNSLAAKGKLSKLRHNLSLLNPLSKSSNSLAATDNLDADSLKLVNKDINNEEQLAKSLKPPNPEECLTRLPVHQDESFNESQHYGTLGQVQSGSKSVDRKQMLQELKSIREKQAEPKSEKEAKVETENNPPEVSEESRTPLKTDKVSHYKKKQTQRKNKLNSLAAHSKLSKLKQDSSFSNPLPEGSDSLVVTGNFDADSLELVNKLVDNDVQLEYLDTAEIFEDDEELDFKPGNKKGKGAKKKTKADILYDEKIKLLVEKLKNEHQIQYLLAYFDACSKSGNLKQALQILYHFRERKYWQLKNALKEILFFNFFLRECASIGDLKNVKRLTKIINDDSLQMTAESFAYIFECVGRTGNSSAEIDFLRSMKEQMDKSQISFNDILTKPIFVRDKLEKILQAVRLLEPNFEPVFETQEVDYNCNLLENIFENRTPESPAKGLFSYSDLEERKKRQFKIEIQGHVEIKSVATRGEPNMETLAARRKVEELEANWRNQARIAFERNYEALKIREKSLSTAHLHPFLSVLDKEECIDAILREVKTLANSAELFSPHLSYLLKDLGHRLFKKYEENILEEEGIIDNTLDCYSKYCKWYLEGGKEKNSRIKWQLVENEMRKNGNPLSQNVIEWPSNVFKSVGKFLYDIIINDLKIVSVMKGKDISVPAFYIVHRSKYRHLKEEIKPHPGLTKMYRDSQPEVLSFNATLVPTLSPPRPWSSHQSGGYLIKKTEIVRVPSNGIHYKKKLGDIPQKQIYPALDCINQLGTIPWKVNPSILDVAIKVFQDGGSLQLNVPQPPSVLPPAPLVTEDLTEEERYHVSKTRIELKRRKNEMYSLWCDSLYKLSLANHYRDEVFWLPHNMDFRGRVYPIPPHLSQMGSDFARSMLVFAQKKPLGPRGLDWLKIHVINLTGFQKKESIDKRLEYANEILDDILESAANPLTGKMWWATSDEPWQTLAACMEIAKALKSPNPEEYLTGLPVHQDGSCNGLQHYAALGRDQIGAESVNLYPFDKPHDVYSDVVVLVEKIRKLDAENGVEIAQVLEGFIQRKVIKQTIMTTVYGVTKFGAKLQIVKQLKDIENFPQDKVWAASGYLVQKTFESLRSMFTSAKEIQDWFTECAKLICVVTGRSVEWVTPLGLPIIQPYTKVKTIGLVHNPACDNLEKPNVIKQKNAFPPNFVHSLDSTHMMLTSLYCEQAGLTFMSVHDCFWTHPCTVEIMNKICRKQFINLHSELILENLSKSFMETYAFSESELKASENTKILEIRENLNKTLARVPAKGTFDLEKVQFSKYFFS